ncbi:MAG TPA: HEAT repeat domain-containing protein, partial [bacterium]|nr:HEAT repeat domain-containing protein [bacterium]
MLRQILFKSQDPKTWVFAILNSLLGLGYAWGVFSSNAMLISRTGTGSLFYIYLGSSLTALLLAGLLYRMIDRFPRRRIFFLGFQSLGACTVLIWLAALTEPEGTAFYFGIRVFFYAMFILVTLLYWVVASDYFTNYEAKVRYPYFIAFGVAGEILGSFTVNRFAAQIHTINFLLLWGLVLIGAPFLLLFIRRLNPEASAPTDKAAAAAKTAPKSLAALVGLLIAFWISHVYVAYGLDYFYNTSALKAFGGEDQLASFFGKVAIFSLGLVFFYQIFLAGPLARRFGLEQMLWALAALYVLGLGLIHFFPSLITIAIAECLVFFFVDLTAQSLLQPVNKLFPDQARGKIMVAMEAVAFPAGTVLLLLVASLILAYGRPETISLTLFAWSLVFFVFCYFFAKAYLRYLEESLASADSQLTLNAIHARGEPNKRRAAPALERLLDSSSELPIRRAAVLSLGRMRSRASFAKIIECFSVPNESLQLAVVEAISHFENEEGVAAMYHLIRSNENVSFQVRMNATLLLTKLLGEKMRPLLLAELAEDNDRLKANAIESLALLKDPETIPALTPYLHHDNRRVRANAAIALYPFRSSRAPALETIEALLRSASTMETF